MAEGSVRVRVLSAHLAAAAQVNADTGRKDTELLGFSHTHPASSSSSSGGSGGSGGAALRPTATAAGAQGGTDDDTDAWTTLEARRLGDGKLVVRWSGGLYSHVVCYFALIDEPAARKGGGGAAAAAAAAATAAGGGSGMWRLDGGGGAPSEAAAAEAIVAAGRTLFLGFADGAPNVVVTDDPAPAADAADFRFVLVDNGSNRRSRMFGLAPRAS